MSDFITMVSESAKGGNNEQVMWHAVSVADEMLEDIKKLSPEKYDCYMRKMHEALFGCHYTQTLAINDVSKIGEHWTVEDIELNTEDIAFPEGTTKWDKYVCFNMMWHSLHEEFSDKDIFNISRCVFFSFDKLSDNRSIWSYMTAV